VTFEGKPHNSVLTPVRGSALPRQVQGVCESVVFHVAQVTNLKVRVSRLVLSLKADAKGRLWMLWASSLRTEGPRAEVATAGAVMGEGTAGKPKGRAALREATRSGLSAPPSVMGPVSLTQELRVPDRTRATLEGLMPVLAPGVQPAGASSGKARERAAPLGGGGGSGLGGRQGVGAGVSGLMADQASVGRADGPGSGAGGAAGEDSDGKDAGAGAAAASASVPSLGEPSGKRAGGRRRRGRRASLVLDNEAMQAVAEAGDVPKASLGRTAAPTAAARARAAPDPGTIALLSPLQNQGTGVEAGVPARLLSRDDAGLPLIGDRQCTSCGAARPPGRRTGPVSGRGSALLADDGFAVQYKTVIQHYNALLDELGVEPWWQADGTVPPERPLGGGEAGDDAVAAGEAALREHASVDDVLGLSAKLDEEEEGDGVARAAGGPGAGAGRARHAAGPPPVDDCPDSSLWPEQTDLVLSAAGGVGLYGVLRDEGGGARRGGGAPGPAVPVHPVPQILRLLHPSLPCSDYRWYQQDPMFLFKTARVCEGCFLVYAKFAQCMTESKPPDFALRQCMGPRAANRVNRALMAGVLPGGAGATGTGPADARERARHGVRGLQEEATQLLNAFSSADASLPGAGDAPKRSKKAGRHRDEFTEFFAAAAAPPSLPPMSASAQSIMQQTSPRAGSTLPSSSSAVGLGAPSGGNGRTPFGQGRAPGGSAPTLPGRSNERAGRGQQQAAGPSLGHGRGPVLQSGHPLGFMAAPRPAGTRGGAAPPAAAAAPPAGAPPSSALRVRTAAAAPQAWQGGGGFTPAGAVDPLRSTASGVAGGSHTRASTASLRVTFSPDGADARRGGPGTLAATGSSIVASSGRRGGSAPGMDVAGAAAAGGDGPAARRVDASPMRSRPGRGGRRRGGRASGPVPVGDRPSFDTHFGPGSSDHLEHQMLGGDSLDAVGAGVLAAARGGGKAPPSSKASLPRSSPFFSSVALPRDPREERRQQNARRIAQSRKRLAKLDEEKKEKEGAGWGASSSKPKKGGGGRRAAGRAGAESLAERYGERYDEEAVAAGTATRLGVDATKVAEEQEEARRRGDPAADPAVARHRAFLEETRLAVEDDQAKRDQLIELLGFNPVQEEAARTIQGVAKRRAGRDE